MQTIAANKLNAAINSVVKAGTKFNAQLHLVAYSCLALIEANGDTRPLQRLYDTIGGRVTKAALVSWSKAFGKVKVEFAETDEAKANPLFRVNKSGKSDLEGAAACPVLDFKPEAKAKAEFDLAARIKSLLKAAEEAGADKAAETAKAYALICEAERVLNGQNVIPAAPHKGQKSKPAPTTAADLAA